MKTLRFSALLLLSAGLAAAATVDFNTDSAFDDNFVKLGTGTDSTFGIFSFASPSTQVALRKTGTGTQSFMYDTSATGGSGGTGGTSGDRTELFGDVTVSADMRVGTLNSPSLGLWSRVNAAGNSGYLGLINIISATSVQLRIFDSNSSPSGTSVGTALFNQTFSGLAAGTFDTSSFYTVSFNTTTTLANQVEFTLSISTLGGQSIASTGVVTDTTSPVLADGQAGLRAAGTTLYIDNFTIAAIPEPSSFATLLGLVSLGGVLVRRRR